jgi:3-hydroxyacyl-[acyl-carrier-protein] dehydratase
LILQREDILNALPHRDPFLFIDAVESCNEHGIVALREVSGKEDFFKGHYPNNPIMPGVLLCECIFQAGAIFIGQHLQLGTKASSSTPVVTRIQNVKFRSPVRPGDQLRICASLVEIVSGVYFLKGHIEKAGRKVVTLEFACTLMDEAS